MLLAIQPLLILAVAAGIGAIGLASWYFSPHQRTLRALRSVPRVSIAEAVDGSIVRIVGELRSHAALLQAPLTGRACACFVVHVEEQRRHGKRTSWRTLVHESRSRDFVVEDETGRAIVQTRGIEVAVVLDHHERSGFLADAPPALDRFLAGHGHSTTGLFGLNKTIRYREGALEPGETVAVLGRARWEDDPEPGTATDAARGGYRETARRRRLVIEAGELGPVRASDDPAALT